ncbi:MAG: TIGR00730 family Rossman fold protein [Bacteroides sp.]|nr:TIGR00730 family Rossman fold protein [Bacteroides sp.]
MNLTNELPSGVVVYCASSSEIDSRYLEVARRMGELIADSGLTLVCGGGAGGMMATAIEGAIARGGEAVGVLPHFMIEKKWNHPQLTCCIDTESMHHRKMTMASMARAAVALPGGIGTLDELAEIMTWHQLGLFKGPVIIVNTDGFYDDLVALFESMRSKGFMRGGIIPATVVATPSEAIAIIRNISRKDVEQ